MPVQAPPLQEISFLVAPEFLARRGHFSPGGFSETAATCHCLFRVSLLPIASFHSLEGPHCGRGRIGSGFLNANPTSEVNDKWLPGSEGQFHTAKAGWRCRPCRDAVPPSRCLFHYYVSVWQEWRSSECIHVQFHFEEVYVLFSLRSSQKTSICGKGNTSDLPSSHFLTSPLMTGGELRYQGGCVHRVIQHGK